MSNTIDKIKYTVINGIICPDLRDILTYIKEQSHPQPGTYVDLTSDQAIGGEKTFTEDIIANGGVYTSGIGFEEDSFFYVGSGSGEYNGAYMQMFGNESPYFPAAIYFGTSHNTGTEEAPIISGVSMKLQPDTKDILLESSDDKEITIGVSSQKITLGSNNDLIDTTSAQSISGVKTFTSDLNWNNQCFVHNVKLNNQTRDDIKAIAASYGKTNITVVIPYMQFSAAESPDGQNGSAWYLIVNYWGANNVGIRAICNFKNVTATSLYASSWGTWNTEGITTDISSTVTKQSTTSGTITLYKCGKMRQLIFKDVASTSTGTVNLCTLASADRPPQNYEYFVVNGTTSGKSFACDFGTNGVVHVYGYSTASVATYGSITYFVS